MVKDPGDIVITGMGVCCNLGDDLDQIVPILKRGEPVAFTYWPPADEVGAKCKVIGEYTGDVSDDALGVSKKEARFMGRAARLALKAARTALAQAGISDPSPLAVVAGSGTGDVNTHIAILRKLDETRDAKRVGPTNIPKLMASTVSANLVNVLRTTGPSFSATAACAGGNYNILTAAQLIRSGHAVGALVGGVETTDTHFHAGFDAMFAYNSSDNDNPTRASKPYSSERAGFIFGEGAGIMVIETRRTAEARGARILSVLRGFGVSSDGQGQMVAPSANGAERAMRMALKDAKLPSEDIDYINTHGTSTPLGDVSEVRAIRETFDGRHVAYSSTKGYTGHCISAAGAIEAAFTIRMLDEGWIAPSVNALPLDPELKDYAPVIEPTSQPLRHAMCNSFGFGGTNAVLVLSSEGR